MIFPKKDTMNNLSMMSEKDEKQSLLHQLVLQHYENDPQALLQLMKVLEFGIVDEEERSPITASITSGILFFIGSLPSLLPFVPKPYMDGYQERQQEQGGYYAAHGDDEVNVEEGTTGFITFHSMIYSSLSAQQIGLFYATIGTVLSLLIVGGIKTWATRGNWIHSSIENLLIAGIGGILAYSVGTLFDTM